MGSAELHGGCTKSVLRKHAGYLRTRTEHDYQNIFAIGFFYASLSNTQLHSSNWAERSAFW
jgi:hypothetical protein